MNLGVGILHTLSHSLLITLYFSTESRGTKSNPPKTKISCDSKIDTAECVHLACFIDPTQLHSRSPYQNFYTLLMQLVPSKPPMAQMPSARTAAERARLGSFILGSNFHFQVLGSQTSTDLRGSLFTPPKPPMAQILLFLPTTTASSSLGSCMDSTFRHSPVVTLRVSTELRMLSPSLPPMKQRRWAMWTMANPLLFLPMGSKRAHLLVAMLQISESLTRSLPFLPPKRQSCWSRAMQPNLDRLVGSEQTSSHCQLKRFSFMTLLAYSLKPPRRQMLFRSPRKEVMLDMKEWHSDYFGSTAEMSLFIWFTMPHFTYFSLALELLEFDLAEMLGVFWTARGVEMSFFALTFFLLERLMLGGGATAFRTALMTGVSLPFLNWPLVELKLDPQLLIFTVEGFFSFFYCRSVIRVCRFLEMASTIPFLEYMKLGAFTDSSGVWLIEAYIFSLEPKDSRNQISLRFSQRLKLLMFICTPSMRRFKFQLFSLYLLVF